MKFIDLKNKLEIASITDPTVLCVGNFDGVHLGHRQLVDSVLLNSEKLKNQFPDIRTGAWFFDSTSYKSANDIYSIHEKIDAFADLGLDYAIIADFDEVKSLSPEEFVQCVLTNDCKCIHAVCGENFRFGSRAMGDAKMLSELMNGNTSIISLLSIDGCVVSSTYIRELLSQGEIERANLLLGDNYSICEKVVHGKALGRKLGIPTVNQNVTNKKIILKNGIYSTICTLDGNKYFGVTNVGTRPTVENTDHKNVETYLIAFEGECYDKEIKIEFLSRVRDEMKFESVEALTNQIKKDISTTKAYFNIQ